MKILLIGVVALVLGVGGGAFMSGSKVKEQLLAEATQAAADSVEAAHAAEETGQHEEPEPEPAVADPESEVPPTTGGEAVVQVTTATAPALTPEEQAELLAGADSAAIVAAAEAEAERLAEEGARKLSKIFGAMQTQDAAAVLQEMEDEEIEMILKHMSDRLAGQILGVFEPARAAALSRVVLGTRNGS